jgi:hypothetical protein
MIRRVSDYMRTYVYLIYEPATGTQNFNSGKFNLWIALTNSFLYS